MINFQKKSARNRAYKYAGSPIILVDARPEEGKGAGFGLNREAVELLGLNLTGEEYLAFVVDGQRTFATVVGKDEPAYSYRVGKVFVTTGDTRVVRGSNKPAWEYLNHNSPLTSDNETALKFVKTEEVSNTGNPVFELVALMPEADNSEEAREEAEAADWADAQEVTQDTTPEFGY